MHSAMPENTSSVGSVLRSATRRSGKYEMSMRGDAGAEHSLEKAKPGVLEACLADIESQFSGRRMQVHLSGEVQDEMETSESENRTYFVGICNKFTLELLPLLVCERDNILYSVVFNKGPCLKWV